MSSRLSSLSLRTKLLSLALSGALGTLLVGGVALWILNESTSPSGGLASANTLQRAQGDADMMHDNIRGLVYAAQAHRAASDNAGVRTARTDLLAAATRMHDEVEKIATSAPDSSIRTTAAALLPVIARYGRDATASVDAAPGDATALALKAVDADFSGLEVSLGALGDDLGARATAAFASLAATKTLVIAAVAISMILTILLALLVERGITTRVHAVMDRAAALRSESIAMLKQALDALAAGDLTVVTIPPMAPLVVSSTDEIGTLAVTMNEMIVLTEQTVSSFNTACGTVRQLASETERLTAAARAGDLQARAEASRFTGSYQALVSGINATLDAVVAPMGEATAALERLAARDLTARMTGEFHGDHATIQRAFNSAMDSLSATMGAVATNAANVAESSVQIDGESATLAQSASDQAAALEEVSASARELSAMTKRNADSASEGQILATGANASATNGVKQVQELAQAIDQIRVSSEATAKIVRTIDEIAFQTNLLALNAAVEAARAGDSGRGFAVVADEVRRLALRSAEAARQTADLIDESVQSTRRGVDINDRVLAQLTDIETRVSRVGQVVREIAAASDEQAKGVAMIDSALEDMAQRTQAVAAHADQSKDASSRLDEHSHALQGLVDTFVLADDATEADDAHAAAGRAQFHSPVRVRRVTPASAGTARFETLPRGMRELIGA